MKQWIMYLMVVNPPSLDEYVDQVNELANNEWEAYGRLLFEGNLIFLAINLSHGRQIYPLITPVHTSETYGSNSGIFVHHRPHDPCALNRAYENLIISCTSRPITHVTLIILLDSTNKIICTKVTRWYGYPGIWKVIKLYVINIY